MAEARKRLEKEIPDLVIGIIMLAVIMIVFFFSIVTSLSPPTGQAIVPTSGSMISVGGMLLVLFIALYLVYQGTR
jgi:Kef-type K+ transport system membrane component KefB